MTHIKIFYVENFFPMTAEVRIVDGTNLFPKISLEFYFLVCIIWLKTRMIKRKKEGVTDENFMYRWRRVYWKFFS